MRSTDIPIAILCSDLHLSLKPPLARSTESNWFAAMERHLCTLSEVQKEFNCPIICAGDIFDRWNAPVELVNFAIKNLPPMFAVPGQHDLPMHSYEEIERTAYWTLVAAGRITNLDPKAPLYTQNLELYGSPWGFDIPEISKASRPHKTKILVSHRYVWTEGNQYQGAETETHLSSLPKAVGGFDLAVFGDNHKGFTSNVGKTSVYNCGGFFIRKTDEGDYTPAIGILYASGAIERGPLDISEDKIEWKVAAIPETKLVDTQKLIDELNKIGDSAINFVEVVEQLIKKNKLDAESTKIVLEALEHKE